MDRRCSVITSKHELDLGGHEIHIHIQGISFFAADKSYIVTSTFQNEENKRGRDDDTSTAAAVEQRKLQAKKKGCGCCCWLNENNDVEIYTHNSR